MMNLSREMQPDSALEVRVVSALTASGLVRRRRSWQVWGAAAAAAILVVAGVVMFRQNHTPAIGDTYAVLLYEDSTYVPAPPGHNNERVAVLSHWADSLYARGKYVSAGRLIGPGPLGGLFIVRATDAADAARIAASCPFHQWGGHIEVKRYER